MSPQARTLLILVLLLAAGAGVGLYAWKGVYEKDETETKQKDVNERLFAPTRADEKGPDGGVPLVEFVKLSLSTDAGTAVLAREPGKDWTLTAPVEATVDKITVDGVVSQLQTSKFKYVADENPDDAALEKYGLKSPQFVVEAEALIGDAKEKRQVKLVGGAENPFNGSIFMRRNDEKQVWAAEGGVKWSFQKTPFDLRDKEVLSLDEPKLTQVEVKTKNNEYKLERDVEKSWLIRPATPPKSGEAAFLADQGAIVGAIGGIKAERAVSFPVDNSEARSSLGLYTPFEDLTFKMGPDSVRVRLSKGSPDAGEKVYVLREDSKGALLAELSPNALSHFDRNPHDLRDKSIIVFKRDAVAKVTFHLPEVGPDIVVEKEDLDAGGAESWRVTAPQQGKAKQFKLAALLWTLGSIKSSRVADEAPKDLKKYGLSDKARWVSVSGGDGRELARMIIGGDVPNAPGQKYFKGTREQVLEADGSRLVDLPTKLDDVLDTPPPPPLPVEMLGADAGPPASPLP